MIFSIDQVQETLDDIADAFPQALFEGLNGGVNLLEEALPDENFPEGELYILGEYCQDMLGRYVNLYHGSFAALAEREEWDRETWVRELRTTFAHELTHHIESLGGLHALDDRDEEEMAAWRLEFEEE